MLSCRVSTESVRPQPIYRLSRAASSGALVILLIACVPALGIQYTSLTELFRNAGVNAVVRGPDILCATDGNVVVMQGVKARLEAATDHGLPIVRVITKEKSQRDLFLYLYPHTQSEIASANEFQKSAKASDNLEKVDLVTYMNTSSCLVKFALREQRIDFRGQMLDGVAVLN